MPCCEKDNFLKMLVGVCISFSIIAPSLIYMGRPSEPVELTAKVSPEMNDGDQKVISGGTMYRNPIKRGELIIWRNGSVGLVEYEFETSRVSYFEAPGRRNEFFMSDREKISRIETILRIGDPGYEKYAAQFVNQR